jgi:hypothetical protein
VNARARALSDAPDDQAVSGRGGLGRRPYGAVADGLVAGVLGAASVAFAHGVYDLLAGAPFRTPSVLAALVFGSLPAAQDIAPSVEATLYFTLLHGALWILMGIASSALISLVDSHPRLWQAVFAFAVCFYASLLHIAGAFSIDGLPPLHLWIGTLLGAAAMAWYLAVRHPKLMGRIERTHVPHVTRQQLIRSAEIESAAARGYRRLAKRFPDVAGFEQIVAAKAERAARAMALASHFDLVVQPKAETNDDPVQGLESAIAAAIASEQQTAGEYGSFLASVQELRIRDAFLRLQQDDTITILERCLGNEHQELPSEGDGSQTFAGAD